MTKLTSGIAAALLIASSALLLTQSKTTHAQKAPHAAYLDGAPGVPYPPVPPPAR